MLGFIKIALIVTGGIAIVASLFGIGTGSTKFKSDAMKEEE